MEKGKKLNNIGQTLWFNIYSQLTSEDLAVLGGARMIPHPTLSSSVLRLASGSHVRLINKAIKMEGVNIP